MLDRVAFWLWALLGAALVLISLREGVANQRWAVSISLVPALMLATPAAFARSLGARTRALCMVAAMAGGCLVLITQAAFHVPNPFVALSALVVLLSLFTGMRTALWVLAALLVGLAAAGAMHAQGIAIAETAMLDAGDPGNWMRVILVFVGITAATVVCVGHVTSRLETALDQSQALNDALVEEGERTIAALRRQTELEQQLRQAQKLEALGTLAGGVAHDFNNMLVVIGSHAELVGRRAELDQRAQASLSSIRDATQRAAELTRQLLTFSRAHHAEPTTLELNQTASDSLAMIGRLLPDSVQLRFHAAPGELHVQAAPVDLDQVLMNLCINARDAMPEGGTLEVAIDAVGDEPTDGERRRRLARIRVRDTGDGIAEADRDRVFDPFFTTKGAEEGTGLGLSVVHGIVTRAGGSIELDSSPGRGTEVRVCWPLVPRPGAAVSGPAPRATATPHGDALIMLVDDDPQVREVIAATLREAGYRVIACADGAEAVASFRERRREVALVISDAVMPRMGGIALYDALAAERPNLPFLVCSGYSRSLPPNFFDDPRRAFIAKPFARAELLRQVAELIASGRAVISEAAAGGAWRFEDA
jgi:signal transduction histidine kinase/CheY-like chemotaxis protein